MTSNKLDASKSALFNAMTGMAMFTLAAVFPELAFAQTNGLSQVSNELATNVNTGILPIISIGSYVGGTVLGISTLLDAKKYSENPSQNGPLSKIATKGVVAAGLFSLPTVMADIQDSLFTRSDQADFSKTQFQPNVTGGNGGGGE